MTAEGSKNIAQRNEHSLIFIWIGLRTEKERSILLNIL